MEGLQVGPKAETAGGQNINIFVKVANYLRDNKVLKARVGLLNNTKDVDFFRYKRVIRALLSDDYKQKSASPKNGLIEIGNEQQAQKVFIQLIQGQFIVPVEKLHYSDIKKTKRAWKPNKSKPTLVPVKKVVLDSDFYFAWNYTKPNPFILLYSILLIAAVFAVILFPLWPRFMKTGVWYLSMAVLCLLGLFFLIAILRLIIYIVTLLAMPRAFWLYPNLFEDCGVLESFVPLYAWEEPKGAKKSKKATKSKKSTSEPTTDNGTSSTTTGAQKSSSTTTQKRKVVLEEVDE